MLLNVSSQCVREILCKLSDHRDVDNAGKTPAEKHNDDAFLTRSDHANHELHRIREENLEGAGAGENCFISLNYSLNTQY